MSKNKVILYFSSIIIVSIFIIIINPYLTTKKNNSKDSSTIIMTNYSGYSSKTFETWTALNSFDSSRKELHLNALFPNSVWTFETDRRNNSWDLRQSLSKPFLLRFDWLELLSLRLCVLSECLGSSTWKLLRPRREAPWLWTCSLCSPLRLKPLRSHTASTWP